jgi:hypothetical protein
MIGGLAAAGLASATNDKPYTTTETTTTTDTYDKKVIVCKYVGTPGVDETLQSGNNPINVSVNSLGSGFTGSFPYSFADAQGRSVAIRYATGPNESGSISECEAPPPPTDVCPNLEGNQSEVPDGYELVDGQCILIPPPVDVCPNLEGDQTTVPDGYTLVDGQCVIIPPPTDVCPNLEGVQETVPEGYTLVEGECVIVPPPTDVCPNLEGIQQVVPEGMVKDEAGNCVTPEPPTERCPPGYYPGAGKDGEPGNQECCPDANNDQKCDETPKPPTDVVPPVEPPVTSEPPVVKPPVTKPPFQTPPHTSKPPTAPKPPKTVPPVVASGGDTTPEGELPFTGFPLWIVVLIGLGLVGAGIGLLYAGKRY